MRTAIVFWLLASVYPDLAFGQTCGGFKRWAVMVGSDPGITSVDFNNPVTTSLHDLVNLRQPMMPSRGDHTTRTSLERAVRVVDARLVQFEVEAGKDGDNDSGYLARLGVQSLRTCETRSSSRALCMALRRDFA